MNTTRSVNGIPWTFLDSEAEWVAWQNRIAAHENETTAVVHEIVRTLGSSAPLTALSRQRLERMKEARELQARTIRTLLQAFFPFDSKLYDVTLALRSRLHRTHGMLSYSPNILRDWAAFGEEENRLNLELLRFLLGAMDAKNTLVAGAGAGRLAYDFHQNLSRGTTLAFDHNPLLLSFAKKMSEGQELLWADFPQNPSSFDDSAVVENCKAPAPARAGLHFELGDILANSLSGNSFDLILTPWVIDILPESFGPFALRMNSLLAPDGAWINFGPLAFSQKNILERHSKGEVLEILEASGFRVEHHEDRELPYLRSPHQRGSRIETVFGFRARKIRDHAAPPARPPLPDFIMDPRLPVPMSREIAELKQKSMIFGTVCSWMDGKRSILELSALLHSQYGIPARDAELALRKFLSDQV